MPESPKGLEDKEMRRKPPRPTHDPRDLKHDDRGVGTGRSTEDERTGEARERDGWNSNT